MSYRKVGSRYNQMRHDTWRERQHKVNMFTLGYAIWAVSLAVLLTFGGWGR